MLNRIVRLLLKLLFCLPLSCFCGRFIYKTILNLLTWCLSTLTLIHEKELWTCAIYLVSQWIPIIHLLELSYILSMLSTLREATQYWCIRDESVYWATLSCCHHALGYVLLLLHKEAIRLASAPAIDILTTPTVAAVKFTIRGLWIISLLFSPILCVSLTELLFTWQLVTLVLWLILVRHALCNTTLIKTDTILLQASLTRLLSITVQLT